MFANWPLNSFVQSITAEGWSCKPPVWRNLLWKVDKHYFKCEKCTCLARENVFTPSREQMYSRKSSRSLLKRRQTTIPQHKLTYTPLPKAQIVSEPIPINSPSAGCGTLGIKGLLVVGCVMSWTAAAAVRRGPECGGMWRLEGRKPGCTGIQEGDGVGEGRGTSQEGKGSHTVCQSHTTWANAKCLPVTAQSVKHVIILRLDT